MEIFKCFHGMNPIYLNVMFCKQEIKYNFRDKNLLEQPNYLPQLTATGRSEYAVPFEITNMDRPNYDDFKLKLTALCHSSDLDKLKIFWFCSSFYTISTYYNMG